MPIAEDDQVPTPKPLRPFVARTTYRRWAHLVLGAALAAPYVAVSYVLGTVLTSTDFGLGLPRAAGVAIQGIFVLLAASATALLPVVRRLEGTVARELLGGPVSGMAVGPARTWPDRRRTAAWYVVHLGAGTLIGSLTLAVPPLILLLLLGPLFSQPGGLFPDNALYTALGAGRPWSPLAGLALIVAGYYLVAGIGAVLARIAPALLGPSPQDRLAEAEERVRRLAERNRIASELHDSVGHTLSVVALQASAAAQLLDRDPAFTREALGVIEESSRTALADLDQALAVLRADGDREPTVPQGLGDLGKLIRSTDLAGLAVHTELSVDLDRLPARVSREAYRIVREALTNTLRHAEGAEATVRITEHDEELAVEITNPLTGKRRSARTSGTGIAAMRDRVAALGGSVTAGADGTQWRLAARLPLRS